MLQMIMAHTVRRYDEEYPLYSNLQIFGEGGDGGAGAAPGGDAAPGGEAAPGVTEPAAEAQPKTRRKRDERMPVEFGQDVRAAQTPAQEQAKPAEAEAQPEETFESLIKGKYKKEYGEAVQNVINQRFKAQKAEDAKARRMEQLLSRMSGSRYDGITGEDGRLDLDALEKAVDNDDELLEEQAAKRGLSVDTYKYVDKLEREKAQREQQDRDAQQYAQYQQVLAQAEAAKKLFPNLDLFKEMDNPAFARLIRAAVPVETAYKVIHADEIAAAMVQHTAQQQAKAISNTIQAGAARPAEGGLNRQAATNTTRITDPRLLTREQRKELRRRVERGEEIVW